MNLLEITQLVIVPVILILIGVFTFLLAKAVPSLVALVKSKVTATMFEILKSRALTYVSALAQDPAWQGLEGAEKKQRALLWLTEYCEGIGLPLTPELADKLVEEAYLSIKLQIIPALQGALK